MRRFFLVVGTALTLSGMWSTSCAEAPAQLDVEIGFLTRKKPTPPTYEVDPLPPDEGLAGAQLGIKDNNTTGAFTGQHYTLDQVVLGAGQSPADEARKLLDKGARYLVADLPADDLIALADAAKASGAIVFDAASQDDRLRGTDCRGNLFHMAPSRAMLTDALAQFFAFKQWSKLFLIVGPAPADARYADALRASAKKFGLTIAAEKPWTFGPLAKARGDSITRADALVFTRGLDYDIMVVADEAGDFGNYIPYHTWDAKLLAGTQGLIAASWHPTHDAYGAEQLQNRFLRLAKRRMRPIDYQSWMAVRAVGEAVTRTKATDPKAIADLMVSDAFALAAFKGVPVSFRPWDRQLRQPLLLAQPEALVGLSPQPGYLHQRTPLDTLGVDEPETTCRLK